MKFDETIPGTVPIDGAEIVYFRDNGLLPRIEQFHALTGYTEHPHAQNGGVSTYGCRLFLPDGSVFHAIGYHGDIQGWRKDIEEGAAGLNIPLARIDADKIIVSDGRVFDLSACVVKFENEP